MKAKLIKENNFYKLIQNNTILAKISTNESINIHYSFGKLSLKNCQAIESGYDLDELAKTSMNKINILFNHSLDSKSHTIGFRAGWQHALKILGDKKYSEDDMLKSFSIGVFTEKEKGNHTFEYEEYIQSLQQAEWDVEIVTTKRMENGKSGLDVPIVKPKLDTDGCLILKRI